MRVLHVIPSMGPAYGGPTTMLQELSAALSGQGLAVEIATTDADGRGRLPYESGTTSEARGVVTRYFSRQGRGSFVFSWPLTRWLWRHQSNYDLIHLHAIFAYPTFVASRIAQRLRVPYVVTPHGMVEPWCLTYKGWKKQPYLRLIERQTLARAAALHALVGEEKNNLRALGLPNSTFVLPNGINFDEFADAPDAESFFARYPHLRGRKIVLFLGRIDPKKGLDHLAAAFAELSRDPRFAEDLHLVIAGPDLVDYARQVKAMIEAEGVEGRVTFTGMLTGELKLSALAAAAVFALPSRSEGFSMAVLEALAAGCPVVITEACNFAAVAAERAGLVIKGGAEELRAALGELLGDEQLRGEMGDRGRRMVSREYHWPVLAGQLSGVYSDILAGTKRSDNWAE